jgi:hypothetical protein
MSLPAHPTVKVVGWPTGDQFMTAGVDEIGADLERLDDEATRRPSVTVVLPTPLAMPATTSTLGDE